MITENVKTLFNGLVAVNSKLLKGQDKIRIKHKDKYMIVKDVESQVVMTKEFDDKWGRGKYSLTYYRWNPDKETNQLDLFGDSHE